MKIQLSQKTVNTLLWAGAGLAVVLGLPHDVFAQNAQNLGGVLDAAQTNVKHLPSLVSTAGFGLGSVFAVAGGLKLKQHTENPTQTPLSHGLGRLGVAGGLMAMGPVINATLATGGLNGNQNVQYNGLHID